MLYRNWWILMCLLINLHYLLRYTWVVNNIYVKVYEIHNSSQNYAYFAHVSLSYNLEFGIKSKLTMCITAHYLQHGNIYVNKKVWTVLRKTKDEDSLIRFSKHSLYSLRFELKSNYMLCATVFTIVVMHKNVWSWVFL